MTKTRKPHADIEIRNPATGKVVARVVRESDAGYIQFIDGTTLRCDRAALATDPIAIRVDDRVLLEMRRWPGGAISFALRCSEAVARKMLPSPDAICRSLPKDWVYE